MLENIKYINHINEELDFLSNRIFINENDLHDFAWKTNSKNDKISGFSTGIVTKTVPVLIKCETKEEGLAIKNKLFEIAEKDVLVTQHGKLILGDHYLKCFITGSKKSDYLVSKDYVKIKLTITTDFPSWIKETTVVFRPTSGSGTESGITTGAVVQGKRNFDYNYDFPFDYTSEMLNKTLNNTGFVASNFRLIIYGTCTNPVIHIGGHTYQVFAEVGEHEYLTIDSLTKKITLTKYDGTTENCFSKRNKQSYVFEKIPSGNNMVVWDGYYGFDVILYEERSEPKWI